MHKELATRKEQDTTMMPSTYVTPPPLEKNKNHQKPTKALDIEAEIYLYNKHTTASSSKHPKKKQPDCLQTSMRTPVPAEQKTCSNTAGA